MTWKQARWPPLFITFLTSPCTIMTSYQISLEIYGGFYYPGITLNLSRNIKYIECSDGILQRTRRSLVKLEFLCPAAVTCLFGFSSYDVNELMAVKKIVCFMRAFQIDIRFEQSIESWISLNSKQPFLWEKLYMYIGRQNERCFGNDIENFQFVTFFQAYRKFKMESLIADRKG